MLVLDCVNGRLLFGVGGTLDWPVNRTKIARKRDSRVTKVRRAQERKAVQPSWGEESWTEDTKARPARMARDTLVYPARMKRRAEAVGHFKGAGVVRPRAMDDDSREREGGRPLPLLPPPKKLKSCI